MPWRNWYASPTLANESYCCATQVKLAAFGVVETLLCGILVPVLIFVLVRGVKRVEAVGFGDTNYNFGEHTTREFADRFSTAGVAKRTQMGSIKFGWILSRYNDQSWFWEFIIMGRKFLFAAIPVLLPSSRYSAQIVWALYLLITLLAYSLQKHHQPFKQERRTSWGGDVSDGGRWRCGCGRRMRAADTMNATESSFLITQALTIGIGGLYIFGLLDDKDLKNWDDWLSMEGLVVRPCATIFRYYPHTGHK